MDQKFDGMSKAQAAKMFPPPTEGERRAAAKDEKPEKKKRDEKPEKKTAAEPKGDE